MRVRSREILSRFQRKHRRGAGRLSMNATALDLGGVSTSACREPRLRSKRPIIGRVCTAMRCARCHHMLPESPMNDCPPVQIQVKQSGDEPIVCRLWTCNILSRNPVPPEYRYVSTLSMGVWVCFRFPLTLAISSSLPDAYGRRRSSHHH